MRSFRNPTGPAVGSSRPARPSSRARLVLCAIVATSCGGDANDRSAPAIPGPQVTAPAVPGAPARISPAFPEPAACHIQFTPLPTGQCDSTADGPDADLERIGVQRTFSLTSDCDRVTLVVDEIGHRAHHGGEHVEITVDLYEGSNELYATAASPGQGRYGETPTFVHDVDAIAPEVNLAFPTDGQFVDEDLPGARREDESLIVPLRYSVGDAVHSEVAVNGDLRFEDTSGGVVQTEVALHLGENRVEVLAFDRCGNEGRRSAVVRVEFTRRNLEVRSPRSGANLTRADDLDPGRDGVQFDALVAGTDLSGEAVLECRPAGGNLYVTRSLPFAVREAPVAVPVSLPDGIYACRARHGDTDVVSDDIDIAVTRGGRETLTFLTPDQGAEIQAATVDVQVAVEAENGTLASLTVGENVPRYAVVRDGLARWRNTALEPGANALLAIVETAPITTGRITVTRVP